MGGGLCIQSGWLRRDKTSGNCSASFYKIISYSLANGWTHANQLPLIFMSHWIRRTQIDLICWSKQLELNSGCRTFTWKKTYPFPLPRWNHLPCYWVAKKECVSEWFPYHSGMWLIHHFPGSAGQPRIPVSQMESSQTSREEREASLLVFSSSLLRDQIAYSSSLESEGRSEGQLTTPGHRTHKSNQTTGCLAFKPL